MSYAEFEAIQIGIASPEQIREWSYGEVIQSVPPYLPALREGIFLLQGQAPLSGMSALKFSMNF